MGGTATMPAAPTLSPHWYVRHVAITRAENGFADSRFLIEVAFGDFRPEETDPVTGLPLFTTYGKRVLSFSGADLLEWLNVLPAETRSSLMQTIQSADTSMIDAIDALLGALKTIGRFDDTAMPHLT